MCVYTHHLLFIETKHYRKITHTNRNSILYMFTKPEHQGLDPGHIFTQNSKSRR